MANWSPDRQQAVQARCDKATKGPWHSPGFNEVHTDHDRGVFVGKDDFGDDDCVVADYCTDDNADFIAHARQDLPDALAVIAAKDAEIARLTTRSDEGHAAHAASFDALLKIAVAVQDGEVDSYDSLADKTIALLARQQADLTRLAEVGKAKDAVLSQCADALESDATLDQRRAAFEAIQELYEPTDAKEAARE